MRIVFCEDEAVIRKLLHLSLRDLPHEYRIAASGEEALELVREWHPDALVTDVAMPGMNGLELAAAVRADPALRATRIALMTASIDRGDPEFALHLRKPFGPAALRALLEALAGEADAGHR